MEDFLTEALRVINNECLEYKLPYHYSYLLETKYGNGVVHIKFKLYAIEGDINKQYELDLVKGDTRKMVLLMAESIKCPDDDISFKFGKDMVERRFFTSMTRILLLGTGSPFNIDPDTMERKDGLILLDDIQKLIG